MAPLLIVATAAVLIAALARWRAEHGGITLDGIVVAPTLALVLVGIAATLLAVFGRLVPGNLTIVAGLVALCVWPWRLTAPPSPTPRRLPRALAVALLITITGGVALRLLPHDYALAGRDQGTYTLRAEYTAATGRLDLHDAVLTRAAANARERSGPGDILGLLPTSGERWRQDQYEGAYRPGLYLADRQGGHVVPQLFHLHPVLLACARMAVGAWGPGALVILEGAWGLLAVAAVGRRLWPRGPWMLLPAALLSVAPLVVWVQRSALSEGLALLLLWTAVLSTLRAADGERNGLSCAALLLGASAWVRGHGLLVAPAVAIALWAVPTKARATVAIYGALVMGSLLVHAATVYPYVHDELARIVPGFHPRPPQLVALGLCAVLGWDGIRRIVGQRSERFAQRSERFAQRWLAHAPRLLIGALLAAVALWFALRLTSPPKPFARLDPLVPLVGPAVLIAAAAGLWATARQPLRQGAAAAWIAALGVALTLPVLLYARRNLPQGGLYYYGRYLVPELWPVLALAATAFVRRLHARTRGWEPGRNAARASGWVAAAILLGATSMPLWMTPATRIDEFAGARRVVEALAAAIPPGAVVIAGGEGWHNGHTFNQVGGALLLSHGVTVLPYHSREAAYATLHALLVDTPQTAPPVFLLINEATKPYRPRDADGKPTGAKTAALDDLLDAPFAATDVRLLEMFVHRLTPVTDAVPTRVTRDELRMALVRVQVDPVRAAAVERMAPPGKTTPRCLAKKKAKTIELPPQGAAGQGPVALVLVASPGTAASNETWRIDIDGVRVGLDAAGVPPRPRDTLGPFVLQQRPRTLKIRGAKRRHADAACPHGGIAEIRILPLPRGLLLDTPTRADAFAPPKDFGHAIEPVTWVAGAGLSKARPGIHSEGGPLEHTGPSLALRAGQTLTWPLQVLPDGGRHPIDVVLTLARSDAGPDARLEVFWDGQRVTSIEPPAQRAGSWQSEPLRLVPTSTVATIGVRMLAADPRATVALRDVGLFSLGPAHQGHAR